MSTPLLAAIHLAAFSIVFGIEPRADVGDAAFADFARDRGGLAIEPTIALAIAQQNFRVLILGTQQLGPEGRFAGSPLAFNGDGIDQRVILFDATAKQFAQRTRLALGLQAVVFVFHRRALPENEMAARADVVGEILCRRIGQNVQAGSDDEFVGRKIRCRRKDVDGLRDAGGARA